MNKFKKIVFIVDSLSQPRCIKRILSFANNGYECCVYGYDRSRYSCNVFPPCIKVTVLGEMRDGTDYLKKFIQLMKDIKRIIHENKKDSPIYYSFGFISTLIFFLRRQKYIYEISDILYGYPRFSRILWLLKKVDKRVINNSIVTVMTSEGFYDFFSIKKENIVILPNKINSTLAQYKRTRLQMQRTSKIVFSFVGSIRYDTVFRFAEVIGEKFPQHEFLFYGRAKGKVLDKCNYLISTYTNIKYLGEYKNPEDLPNIYDNINVVVACYTPSSLNERIAEPNKLYEALFFCRPIIVSQGIFLEHQVNKYKCGFSIDATSKEKICEFIEDLNYIKINSISNNNWNIKTEDLIDNPDVLLKKVDDYLNSLQK